jgi:LPS sulfotransferase NodH
MESIIDLFPDLEKLFRDGFAGVHCEKPGLMIAMTARSGSTHLCKVLQEAGDFSPITEIFNPRGVVEAEKKRLSAVSFRDYIGAINDQPHRYFAYKTCWRDFAPFAHNFGEIFSNLQLVYLNRRDVFAQAVSLYRAQISGEWHRRPGAASPTGANALPEPNISHMQIGLNELEAEKQGWQAFFASRHLTPLELVYEDFTDDVTKAIGKISAHTSISLDRPIGPDIGLEKLADALSSDWRERLQKHVFQMT